MVHQSTYVKGGGSLTTFSGIVRQHWLNVLLIGLVLHIVYQKDIRIQVNMNGQEAFAARALNPAAQSPTATPLPKSADPGSKEEKAAFSISNLTPVLSPDYGRRHQIPPAIIREKLEICLDYVDRYLPVAREERQAYGIPVSITLAQGLLESNAGSSRLALESNNHFGIKCRRKCRGCTCRNYSDDDVYDMFRVFDTARASYREHSVLLNSSRYKHLLDLPHSDYQGWAHGLKKAGYATDPRYPQKLIQIIEELELYRYDQ